jgi:MFS transporter, DHA2 family, metal-tetracycline-proton antiporter
MQLLQFFGGSISVAVCGLFLEYQKNIPAVQVYQHVYELLLLVCLCSLGVLLRYKWLQVKMQ